MKTPRLIMKFVTVLAIGIAIVGAIFYVNYQSDTQKASSKPVAVRIGYIPIADSAQLYVAIEKGFFAQEAIDVKLASLAGGGEDP